MPKAKQSLDELLHEIKRIEEHREILTEKKIRKIYKQLLKELHGFIGEEYAKHANDQGALSYSSLRDRSRQARFLEEVVAKVDSITPELRAEIMGLVEDTYKSCYEGMAKAVHTASNTEELAARVKGGCIPPEVINQSFNNSISKLTLPNVLEKHRQEIVYAIKSELTIGLVNGDRYEKMARRLTDKLDISYGKATRIVRTESHRNIESGFMNCAEELGKALEGSGLVEVCIWHTMKDELVRPNVRRKTKKGWKTYKSKNGADHVKMEGQTIKAGDFFVFSDGVKTKHPSGSGEARHDCNCRCTVEHTVMTEEEFAKVNSNAPKVTVTNKIDTGVENSHESDIIKSGAISGALNPDGKKAREHATQYYEAVRKMKTDYVRIAKNTGIPEEEVKAVKEFIFTTKHDLGNGQLEYFVPSYDMAESWRRLIDGKDIQPHDLTLLRHEIMEKELMRQGMTQDEAHRLTSKKYNYAREAKAYYDRIKKN